MKRNVLRNERGFTLIEIIAVLIILGILAAVAVPKYMDLQDEARKKSAQAAISEAKARLSNAYAIALLKLNGTNPTIVQVQGNANLTDWGPDYNVTVTAGNPAVITVDKVQTVTLNPTIIGTWNLPQP